MKEHSPRWRELFDNPDYALPVDFHSFRPAFADGLRRSGVNKQTAKAFGGWASDAMHVYLGTQDVAVPDAAVPRLAIVSAVDNQGSREKHSEAAKHSESLARPEGFEPPTFGSVGGTPGQPSEKANEISRPEIATEGFGRLGAPWSRLGDSDGDIADRAWTSWDGEPEVPPERRLGGGAEAGSLLRQLAELTQRLLDGTAMMDDRAEAQRLVGNVLRPEASTAKDARERSAPSQ